MTDLASPADGRLRLLMAKQKGNPMNHGSMGRIWRTLVACTAVAACVPAAWAESNDPRPTPMPVLPGKQALPASGPLPASQSVQLQKLGRVVLAAKQNQQPTAEEQALVAEFRALANDLELASRPQSGKMELTSGPGIASAASSRAANGSEAVRNLVQPRLTRLHERRLSLESTLANGSQADAAEEPEMRQARRARRQQLSQQGAAIERAVQSALALPDAERHAKLMALSRQLKPKSFDELTLERRASEVAGQSGEARADNGLDSTPTLTTLTQHRPAPAPQADGGGGRPSR